MRALSFLLVTFLTAGSALAQTREVAVTFDDLPGIPSSKPLEQQQKMTRDLLRAIRGSGAPTVGFVNEAKLRTPQHARLLRMWLEAGQELGNHTHAHPDLHRIEPAAFEQEILQGEVVTRKLMAARNRKPRWFRHPYLHTGTSLEIRDRIVRFLGEHGYRVAPVTLDNAEWLYAAAYEKATDGATREKVGRSYVEYMDQKLAYFENQSGKLFERNIRHVLLLHANALNAAWFDELAASMRTRGYRFITLERALEDPAYASADTYAGRGGISWLHRWAMSAGKGGDFFAGEPRTPQWIQDLAGIKE